MSLSIRVILDWEEEDVFRDLLVPAETDLYELHDAVIKSFQLESGEMASYYRSNDNWEQGEEIPMMAFDDKQATMEDFKVVDLFVKKGSKLLYVYDFMSMWTFYLELITILDEEPEGIKVTQIKGQRPEQAPEKKENTEPSDLFGDLDLDLSEFEDLDDYEE